MDETSLAALSRRGVSRREMQVLGALAMQLTNAEIADRLQVSERTVESHVSSLLRKFGARNRLELVRASAPRFAAPRRDGDGLPRRLEIIDDQSVFIGRKDALERVLGSWERATLGMVTVVIVRGEAGIGKSRMAARAAIAVHGRGGQVLFGACADRATRPYEPFTNAIVEAVTRDRTGALRVGLGRSAELLGRLDPVVAQCFGIAELNGTDPEHERRELQDAICDFLLNAARLQPTLFVLEDVHWASSGNRDVLLRIASSGASAPLMLVVTARDERPFRDEASGALLGHLAAIPSVDTVALQGFDVDEAKDLIAAVGGGIDASRALQQTNGNPLYLRELARDRGRSLAGLIAARFAFLETGDLEVADAATVTGDQINAQLLASAMGRPLDGVLDALDRMESQGLVGPGDHPGQYAFTHDLFRSLRYASLSEGKRMRLHDAMTAPGLAEPRVRHHFVEHDADAGDGHSDRLALIRARRDDQVIGRSGEEHGVNLLANLDIVARGEPLAHEDLFGPFRVGQPSLDHMRQADARAGRIAVQRREHGTAGDRSPYRSDGVPRSGTNGIPAASLRSRTPSRRLSAS